MMPQYYLPDSPPLRLCYSDNPPLDECHFSLYFAGPHPLLPENHDPP